MRSGPLSCLSKHRLSGDGRHSELGLGAMRQQVCRGSRRVCHPRLHWSASAYPCVVNVRHTRRNRGGLRQFADRGGPQRRPQPAQSDVIAGGNTRHHLNVQRPKWARARRGHTPDTHRAVPRSTCTNTVVRQLRRSGEQPPHCEYSSPIARHADRSYAIKTILFVGSNGATGKLVPTRRPGAHEREHGGDLPRQGRPQRVLRRTPARRA
jgi:hypothetical protein